MKVDEQRARRIVLARAIETADVQGKLLSDTERDQLDLRAVESARTAAGADTTVNEALALYRRAELILEVAGKRDAALVSHQDISMWRRGLMWGIPSVALMFGIATDRIANMHRVDLLSLPLLVIVLWNLAMYVVLFLALFRRDERQPAATLASAFRWVGHIARRGRRLGKLHRVATEAFFLHWDAVTAELNGQRIRQVLHLSAAAWGAGVALSLITRGVVVEYRAGWESTFLSAEQVHSILSILFLPVLTFFSWAPFTLQEISSMRFDAGAGSAVVAHGRRWVLLYSGLILILVVLPRLILAVVAWRRSFFLSRQVTIELSEPYFQRLIDQLCPAQVRLCVYTHRREDRSALDRVLVQGRAIVAANSLISTTTGDVLCISDVPEETTRSKAETVWQRLSSLFRKPPGRSQNDVGCECDIVLHVVGMAGDLDAAALVLHRLGKPVLVLVNSPAGRDQSDLLRKCRLHKKHHDLIAEVLTFDSFARCWVQERVLFEAILQCVPRSKTSGCARLMAAWNDRNSERFKTSMSALTIDLLGAACEVEVVRGESLSKGLFSPERRNAYKDATNVAEAAVAERVKQRARAGFAGLLKLHGIDDIAACRLEQLLEGEFDVRSTLSASWFAAWRNRDTDSSATTVQLPYELLQTLVEERLLNYLTVVHLGHDYATFVIGELRPTWKSEVVTAVEAQLSQLSPLWTAVRDPHNSVRPTMQFAVELEKIGLKVLSRLYPGARVTSD